MYRVIIDGKDKFLTKNVSTARHFVLEEFGYEISSIRRMESPPGEQWLQVIFDGKAFDVRIVSE